jgi:hypothetical protein
VGRRQDRRDAQGARLDGDAMSLLYALAGFLIPVACLLATIRAMEAE